MDYYNINYNRESLHSVTKNSFSTPYEPPVSDVSGFVYGVDTLKSIILLMACVDRFLTPEKAVHLSRLEEEFQIGKWGRVEWAHDLNQQELQTRVAATLLFIHFNSSSWLTQSKSAAAL